MRKILFVCFMLFLFTVPGKAAPAFVQGLFGASGCNSSTACTATFTAANLTAGNTIMACADWTGTGSAITSIQDTTNVGAVFTDSGLGAIVFDPGGNNAQIECWTYKNIVGGSKDAIKVTPNGNTSFLNVFIMEISGVSTSAPVDKVCSGTASASGTAIATGTCTTTSANELLVTFVATNGANGLTAGTGFTLPTALQRNNDAMEYQAVSSTGSYTGTMTGANTSLWGAVMISFTATGSTPARGFPVVV